MSRRGFLVKPDPAKTERCARPGCGDPEGEHLICGCQGFHNGKPCGCPGFTLPAPTCPHCRTVFRAQWMLDSHLRFPPKNCRDAQRQADADNAAKQRAREFRTKRKTTV